MEKLMLARESVIKQKNWYATVILALTLPDICGKIEYPGDNTSTRYKKWCKK